MRCALDWWQHIVPLGNASKVLRMYVHTCIRIGYVHLGTVHERKRACTSNLLTTLRCALRRLVSLLRFGSSALVAPAALCAASLLPSGFGPPAGGVAGLLLGLAVCLSAPLGLRLRCFRFCLPALAWLRLRLLLSCCLPAVLPLGGGVGFVPWLAARLPPLWGCGVVVSCLCCSCSVVVRRQCALWGKQCSTCVASFRCSYWASPLQVVNGCVGSCAALPRHARPYAVPPLREIWQASPSLSTGPCH